MRAVHLNLANNAIIGQKVTVDIVAWLRVGLQEVGVTLTVSDREFRADTPNIIIENQNGVFKKFLDEHRSRVNLICIVTEVLTGEAFNQAGWDGPENRRYNEMMSLAEHYSGFITTVESNVERLRKIAPTTFFEFGFTDLLYEPSPPERWARPFSFTGLLNPHRVEFIAEAQRRGFPLYVPGGTEHAGLSHTALQHTNDDYFDLIKTTAINVSLKQNSDWPIPSPTKLARIGHYAVGCAIEKTEISTRQSRLFPSFDGMDDFVAKYADFTYAQISQEALDRASRYRRELPLKREIERNLSECPALVRAPR